jgi:DNA polymerase-3 subunit beta
MKLTITKDQMLAGLQAVQNIVSTRTTLPVLSNVLIRAEGNQLHLTATDLDVSIACGVEANVAIPGASTVPVKKLFGICRELNGSEIELEVDDRNVCSLRAGPSFYRLNGLAATEFPAQPEFGDKRKVVLPQEKLRGMLRKTSFAISTDETRYVLNGIFFVLKEHKFTMVATDGRRLALVGEDLDIDSASEGQFIVPTKAVNELNRLLQTTGEAKICFAESQVAFRLKDDGGFSVLITSRLVDGTYPNYQQVIPGGSKERIAFIREELLHALRRAELMTSEKSNSVKLSFTKNNLAITANTPEVGEARESIAINYRGQDFAIAFNPVYLMDPLKALDDDEIFLELTDELSPGVMKTNGPFLYVIMPMRMS